jgi:hypothetical protein
MRGRQRISKRMHTLFQEARMSVGAVMRWTALFGRREDGHADVGVTVTAAEHTLADMSIEESPRLWRN